jgi:hypothetical protein
VAARLLLIIAAVSALFYGCGPVWSTTSIADAAGMLKAAEVVDAPKYAPYEYGCAEEYLHQARIKESYSQYERSIDYAKLALEFAKQAKEKAALARAEAPSAPPAQPEHKADKVK